MPTKSYARFVNNIDTVMRLANTYDLVRTQRNSRGRAAFDRITRSAIIFLASSFEEYIEDVLNECCVQHISFSRNGANLPNNVQNTINKYVKADNNSTPPVFFCDDGWKAIYKKITEEKTSKLNTPKKHHIKQLFNDILGTTDASIDSIDQIDHLDDIIKFRGEIAHRVKANKYVTIDDVISRTNTILIITKSIDKMILNYFRETWVST